MINNTNEFSFLIKPSTIKDAGVGVFAAHDIPKGSLLRLFGDGESPQTKSSSRKTKDVPLAFQKYCLKRGNHIICPTDFGHMTISWYVNHSLTPNASHKDWVWYANTDIKKGDEIFVDYNSFDEPKSDQTRRSY